MLEIFLFSKLQLESFQYKSILHYSIKRSYYHPLQHAGQGIIDLYNMKHYTLYSNFNGCCLFQSILTIGTGTLIRLRKRSLVALREIKRENMKGTDSNYKEVTVFLTVAMMQIGYVLTLSKYLFAESYTVRCLSSTKRSKHWVDYWIVR